MASLKDIRTRINSVKTTRQVTSAMKMVSAAKFKKAQDNVEHIRPYMNRLNHIINSLGINMELEENYEWFKKRGKGKVLLVPFSSNRGLAGSFNANVIKETERLIESTYKNDLKTSNLHIMAVGKQVGKALYAHHYPVVGHFNDLYQDVNWETVEMLSEALVKHFLDGDYREIHFIYNQFINAASQQVKVLQFLPFEVRNNNFENGHFSDFIIEPGRDEVIRMLVPKAIHTSFFQVVLESLASEHGARMTAMHKATDNATDLINELQLAYNKARQGAITSEISEIVGGAEAQNK